MQAIFCIAALLCPIFHRGAPVTAGNPLLRLGFYSLAMRRLWPRACACWWRLRSRPRSSRPLAQPVAQGLLCRSAVAAAERSSGMPAHLLAAISRVESGRRDPATGAVHPWPWSVNAEGQGLFYDTKAEAVAAVRAMQANGVRSIDVGCGQINLMHHPDAFPSLEVGFDPQANAAYAAQFLKELFAQTGDWNKAAGMYHSATPGSGPSTRKGAGGLAGGAAVRRPGRRHPVGAGLGRHDRHAARPGSWACRRAATGHGSRTAIIMLRPPAAGAGRRLDAYRATPIGLAYQPPPRRAGG